MWADALLTPKEHQCERAGRIVPSLAPFDASELCRGVTTVLPISLGLCMLRGLLRITALTPRRPLGHAHDSTEARRK